MPLIPVLPTILGDDTGPGGDGAPDAPAAPRAVLTIAGADLDVAARGDARVALTALRLTLDGYDDLAFKEYGCGPRPSWREGQPVALALDGVPAFRGEVAKVQRVAGDKGWEFAYACFGPKRLADYLPVLARDGSGQACFNMPPALYDPSYVPALTGLTVGQIVREVLEVPATAQALDALGVGGFAGLPDNPALAPETVADLAALDIVPNAGVVLSGQGLLNQVEDFVGQWYRTYALWVRPDGVIRLFDLSALPTRPLAIPGDGGAPDPVNWPDFDRDTVGCFARVRVVGRDIATTVLSARDQTLTPAAAPNAAWSAPDQAAWTIAAFEQPRDASDRGTASGVTPNSATVASADATAHWDANFWNGRRGTIYLYNDAVSGGGWSESRAITSCTALAPGGTATITWDGAVPLDSTDYHRYRIVAQSGPVALVGRRFLARDKATGLTGVHSEVGKRLVTAFPRPVAWTVGASRTLYATPTGAVNWSLDGTANGYNWRTVPVEVDPVDGSITFVEPVVKATASRSQLERAYPANFAQGLPTDVLALVAFNRGQLVAEWPPDGPGGRAYANLGLGRTQVISLDNWQWRGDLPQALKLAEQTWKSVCDPVDSGSILHHGWPAGWDVLAMGYALDLSVAGGVAADWDGVPLPARTVTVAWPESGPDALTVTFDFSTRFRPYRGQDLQIHPAYGGIDPGDAYLAAGGDFAPPMMGLPGMGAIDPAVMAAIQAHLGDVSGAIDAHLGGVADAASAPGQAVGEHMAGLGAAIDDHMAGLGGDGDAGGFDQDAWGSSLSRGKDWRDDARGVRRSTLDRPPAEPPRMADAGKPIAVDDATDMPAGRPIMVDATPPRRPRDDRPLSERRGVDLDDLGGG